MADRDLEAKLAQAQVKRLLREAGECADVGIFNVALELYLKAFKILPEVRLLYEDMVFNVFLQNFISSTEQKNGCEYFHAIHDQARRVYPDNAHDMFAVMGRVLLECDFYLEAWRQFQDILDIDNSCACAEFNINEIKHKLVPRWHYRMLNDKTRNLAYQNAIHEIVRPDVDSVLDLGSGTGILAMYAAECCPTSIVGIESDKKLCEISNYLLKDNNIDSIQIINNWSHLLKDSDIGGKKSLLVTEVFDAGLLGEGILESLNHAFKNLLLENGRVLPCRAEFFVRGIKSETLMKAYHLNNTTKELLEIPLNTHVLAFHTDYDCEDIHKYQDLQYMTEPQLLLTVDFNNPEDIEKKLSEIVKYRVELKPLINGEVSTIIGWFNLHLTDNIHLTTDPTSKKCANAWQQAVFSNFIPKQVNINKHFTVDFQVNKGTKIDLLPESESCIKISTDEMQFLNDEEYIELIVECVDIAHLHLQQHFSHHLAVIADLCPFPLFGLSMLKRGAQFLYCCAFTKESSDFIDKIFELNGISKDRYEIIDSIEFYMEDKMIHAIFAPMVAGRHIVQGGYAQNAIRMKTFNLIKGGLFMPYKVTVMGQAIHSPWLDFVHRVNDDNVGYKIAHHMNKFQLSADYFVNLTHFEYSALSDPVVLGVLENMQPGIVSCPIKKSGPANAILCWYNIELLENRANVTTKRVNSFINALVFRADPELQLQDGGTADIICCAEYNHTFRFILDNKD